MRKWFEVEARGKTGGGEISIYGAIGPREWGEDAVSAKAFNKELKRLAAKSGDITIRINSPGGSVGDAMAIYTAISNIRNRVVCIVEGVAYSVAASVALAGRETIMAEGSQLMINNPRGFTFGEIRDFKAAMDDLRVTTNVLVRTYAQKTGIGELEIRDLMEKTTYMTAEEAKERGFIDTVRATGAIARGKTGSNGPTGSAALQPLGRMAQLRKACPGASAESLLSWYESGIHIAAAVASNNARLAKTIKENHTKIKQAEVDRDRAIQALPKVKSDIAKRQSKAISMGNGYRPTTRSTIH